MALMQSCCCWRSLRKGSYASAAYTMVYFLISLGFAIKFLYEEHLYLIGEVDVPQSRSLIEPEAISPATMGFHIVALLCNAAGLVSSMLLTYGIYKDRRALLIPWIVCVSTTITVDLSHTVYMIALRNLLIHPLTGILYTMDFFLLSLNVYCLVCVVSQYQEYKAGRGTASHDMRNCRTPQVKFLAKQGTATVALSRKGASANNCDDEMSPQGESTEKTEEVPSGQTTTKQNGKKHVKFGENEEFHIQYSIISKGEHSDGTGATNMTGVDSEPLIQKRDNKN